MYCNDHKRPSSFERLLFQEEKRWCKVSKNTYASALQGSVNGFGSIPLIAGSVLTKSVIPTANIRVLNP